MKTILAFLLAAWMAAWPCYANPLLMLAGPIPAIAGPTTLVTSPSNGALRNDYSGQVGFGFTANTAVDVTYLGRWMWSGNSGTTTVRLYDLTSANTAVAVNITLTGATVGEYVWSNTPAQGTFPYTLIVGNTYVITATETNGGNQWTDAAPITISSVGTLIGTVIDFNGTPSANGNAYTRVNFQYE